MLLFRWSVHIGSCSLGVCVNFFWGCSGGRCGGGGWGTVAAENLVVSGICLFALLGLLFHCQLLTPLCMLCFRIHTGGELFRIDSQAGDAILKQLWHHSDALLCCSVKTNVTNFPASSDFLFLKFLYPTNSSK